MKTRMLLVVLLQLAISQQAFSEDAEPAASQRIRVGVDIRLGYQSCIDFWTPIAERLSQAMPGYRFVIVPLASHQDLVRVLREKSIDFMSLDPAMELMAEDRFGAAPLATMIETLPGEVTPRAANAASSGAIVRLANRNDMQTINHIRGKRVLAVKPWSLTGWIAQWGLLVDRGINPAKDLKQVSFVGTHGDVVKGLLDGSADVGVVDSDMLFCYLANQKIAPETLCVFNRQGQAVPLAVDAPVASTRPYPGRFLSKAADTSDDLAKQVSDALMRQSLTTTVGGTPCDITWTTPCNTNAVRKLLSSLMGPHFPDSPGYPLPYEYPAWLSSAVSTGIILIAALMLVLVMRSRYGRRNRMLDEELQTTRKELAEVRAERQRINAILALAGCGIDIIDEHHQIVYADASLERKYGDWHGKHCHGYFCNADTPCAGCRMPTPTDQPRQRTFDIGPLGASPADDPHAKVHFIEGESTRMIGIPFRDEGGRWLYARVHFPLAAFSNETEEGHHSTVAAHS